MKSTYYFLSVAFFLSCTDDDNPAPSPVEECEVASISWVPATGDPVTAAFIYGNDGKLTHLTSDGVTWQYTHYATGFSRKSTLSQNWYTVSHVKLDEKGLLIAKYDTTYNGENFSNATTYTYEYNNENELLNIFKNNDPQPSITCTWTNGNLVKLKEDNISYLLDYYPDRPNEDYTFMDLRILFSMGINPCRSKNLLKSLTAGGEQMVFQYEFEQQGKMNEWYATILGNPDTVLVGKQQFDCN